MGDEKENYIMESDQNGSNNRVGSSKRPKPGTGRWLSQEWASYTLFNQHPGTDNNARTLNDKTNQNDNNAKASMPSK
ncbi:hypothetical protein OAT84_02520 [Gammaproteobacteria bacterium]|nr:hypothetical protein [Gammaproteobacteria bacterium]